LNKNKQIAAAGSWESPVSTDMIVAGSRRLAEPRVVGDDLVWLEGRPEEKGRVVLVRERADGRLIDLTPAPLGVRSRAHEYGGGVYALLGKRVFFVNVCDQCLYETNWDGAASAPPRAVTTPSARRFADLTVDASRQRLLAISEDHAGDGEPVTTLVAIDPDSGVISTLARGDDFYSSPALNANGTELAYLSWNHPDMPWDATTLWLARVREDGSLAAPRNVGNPNTSHFQPTFSPRGELFVVADTGGWWNLHRVDDGGLSPVAACAREFAFPQWVFGMATFGFVDDNRIAAISTADGEWSLHIVDTRSGELTAVTEFKYTVCEQLHAHDGRIALLAGSSAAPMSVVSARVDTPGAVSWREHRRASDLRIDEANLSVAQPMTFRAGRDDACHGFYYPPCNARFALAADERPPLLVKCHGGPTGQTSAVFDPRIQFWTSRGIAVLDLNYRGSTGYGRDYRHSLWGNWGIYDVEDCRHAVDELSAADLVDPSRCLISGGSAGGYTVLCALTFDEVFAAGASHYGIGDLELLARDTHKFESRYLDRMVGPYPEQRDLYRARSPIHHVEKLHCPVIFFQGLDDKVVPPNQAQTMVSALERNGVLVGYVTFAGEGHGFRNADNIKYALAAELAFYGRVLGFVPAGPAIDLDDILTEPAADD